MEPIGKVNRYVCKDCGRQTVAINLNSGTTPFGVTCPHCRGMNAMSSLYRFPQLPGVAFVTATHAFYRPTREEFDRLDASHQDYVLGGAMLFKPLGEARPLPEPSPPYVDHPTAVAFLEATYGRKPR